LATITALQASAVGRKNTERVIETDIEMLGAEVAYLGNEAEQG
jgi:hypothetical protein